MGGGEVILDICMVVSHFHLASHNIYVTKCSIFCKISYKYIAPQAQVSLQMNACLYQSQIKGGI